MTNLQNYKTILEKHFGSGVVTFDPDTNDTNNVIGALNSDYHQFNAAFDKRLERLAGLYSQSPFFPHLKNALNDLGRPSNWTGAYAELVAFDFLNSDRDYTPGPLSLSLDVPATDTLAADLGMNDVNFDGYYDEYDVCFDVKVLGNKSGEILGNVIKAAKRQLGIEGASIYPTYPADIDFDVFQSRVRPLIQELVGLINIHSKTRYVRSILVPELSYRIMWPQDGGVSTGVSEYDPYQHAENHHTLLFQHAKKFSKVKPSVIVFVIFPWYSESFLSHDICNQAFFRAFARRFFCQYAKDTRLAKNELDGFVSQVAMADVTNKLSGVIFLLDKSITTDKPDEQNMDAFAYFNPNASHKVSYSFIRYLGRIGCWVDDFEHDNY
jgi:hypothetical protein